MGRACDQVMALIAARGGRIRTQQRRSRAEIAHGCTSFGVGRYARWRCSGYRVRPQTVRSPVRIYARAKARVWLGEGGTARCGAVRDGTAPHCL
eukprot:1822835-Prymnesium_polylepis.1